MLGGKNVVVLPTGSGWREVFSRYRTRCRKKHTDLEEGGGEAKNESLWESRRGELRNNSITVKGVSKILGGTVKGIGEVKSVPETRGQKTSVKNQLSDNLGKKSQ